MTIKKRRTKRHRVKLDDHPNHNGNTGDRDPKGRFAKGNRAAAGHGRSFAQRRAEISRRLFAVDDATVEQIIATLEQKAAAGIQWAVTLWFERVAGRAPVLSVREEAEADADAIEAEAEAGHRTKLANILQRLRTEPVEPRTQLTAELLDDLEALLAGGATAEMVCELLCIPYATFADWIKRGQEAERAKSRSADAKRCLRLLLTFRRAVGSHRFDQARRENLKMLERLDPTYAKREAEDDETTYDADERFL